MMNEEYIKSLLIRRFYKKNINIMEIGVFYPQFSSVKDYINDKNCKITLFEPQPVCYQNLKSHFIGDNIKIYPYAIYKRKGKIKLCIPSQEYGGPISDASSFIKGEQSPWIINNKNPIKNNLKEIEVEGRTIDEFDKGNIDILFIDVEGCEWYILQKLISRPIIITIETENGNPYRKKILKWMKNNGYKTFIQVGKDIYFIKNLKIPKDLSKYKCSKHSTIGENDCPECIENMINIIKEIELEDED